MQRKKAQATETLSEGIEVKFKNDFKVTIINMLKKNYYKNYTQRRKERYESLSMSFLTLLP